MNISFQKKSGNIPLGILFFWKMEIKTQSPIAITDQFIPELFFDYFFIKAGSLGCMHETLHTETRLPRRVLKTIHTRPLILVLSAPLTIYGARFSLEFAESFWIKNTLANSFLTLPWSDDNVDDLETFKLQLTGYIQKHQMKKWPYPMLSTDLKESDWLIHFSPRHKRRLYKTTFGLSRKELQNIRNIHLFLEQACDFTSQNPRIIQHINPEVFYDQPHLNHAFKRMTGLSPVEYFQANSILQDHLMSASYNENSSP